MCISIEGDDSGLFNGNNGNDDNGDADLDEKPVNDIRPAMLSKLYRCGFCYQTSSWKHVIEVNFPFFFFFESQ